MSLKKQGQQYFGIEELHPKFLRTVRYHVQDAEKVACGLGDW
jgi:hypothetical protein